MRSQLKEVTKIKISVVKEKKEVNTPMEGKNRAPNLMKTLNFRSIWSKFNNHLEAIGVVKLQQEVVEFKNLRGTNKKLWMTPLK